MVKPYCCPSCRMHHFEQTAPDTYQCHWCGDAFAEQDVIEDGGYHPFEVEITSSPHDDESWDVTMTGRFAKTIYIPRHRLE